MKPMDISAAIVTRVKRTFTMVSRKTRAMARGRIPMSRPARMAARKMPVPVAESQLKLKTAGSAVGAGGGGGVRRGAEYNFSGAGFGEAELVGDVSAGGVENSLWLPNLEEGDEHTHAYDGGG